MGRIKFGFLCFWVLDESDPCEVQVRLSLGQSIVDSKVNEVLKVRNSSEAFLFNMVLNPLV